MHINTDPSQNPAVVGLEGNKIFDSGKHDLIEKQILLRKKEESFLILIRLGFSKIVFFMVGGRGNFNPPP